MSASFSQMKINSDEFNWKNEQGLLTYNNLPAIIIWDQALEILMMSIEEIAGEEKTTKILKTFGKRLGYMVSQSYSGRTDLDNVLIEFGDLYRNAGWGSVKITTFSKAEKRIILEIHHSWEEVVFKAKKHENIFFPTFWVSLIQYLLNEEMDYSISKKSVNGNEFDEIQMFNKA
ncbi:MAG: hypothetical protein WBB47_09445 [Paenisporosarcina sp.]